MLDKKLYDSTLDQIFEDQDVIDWVMKGTGQKEMSRLMDGNRAFRKKALKAREAILLLRDVHEVLDEREVLKIWKKIEQSDKSKPQKVRHFKPRAVLTRAAMFVGLVIIGSLAWLYWQNTGASYEFSGNAPITNNEAKLVLANGEEIRLKNENSKIAVTGRDELLIENDSVIDLRHQNTGTTDAIQMNEVIIPYGKKSKLLLADGTKVWLNAGSRFAFPLKFTEKTREVFLEGEAYFEGARNENKPFIVRASELSIKVLGTRFDVSVYPTDCHIETVLLEGSVSIRKPGTLELAKNETVLEVNQKASFNKKKGSMEVSNVADTEFYIAWTEGWFRFSKESLKKICTKLERYYNVKIIIAPDFSSTELISGKLDLKDSMTDVLKALSDVTDIQYRITGDTIYIEEKIKELPMRN